ncbi:MAG: hypothetical protein AB7U95_26630 [Reyranella sp.]
MRAVMVACALSLATLGLAFAQDRAVTNRDGVSPAQTHKAEDDEDRAVTDEERTRLTEVVKAEGCSEGKMKAEDGKFEVEGATCADGKKWDFKFDAQFELIKKEIDD